MVVKSNGLVRCALCGHHENVSGGVPFCDTRGCRGMICLDCLFRGKESECGTKDK